LRHAVKVTIVISLSDTGEVQASRPTIEAIGEDGGLSAALGAVFNASKAAAVNTVPQGEVVNTRPASSTDLNKANWLAEQIKLPPHELQAALAAYSIARVIEVMDWMKAKARAGELRSPAGLLWKVLGGR